MNLFTQYFAFDLGTYAIKLLSLSPGPSGEGYVLTDFLSEILPTGLVSGGFTNPLIRSLPELGTIVKRLVSQLSSTKEGCILGLPDRWVKLHLAEIALKPHEDHTTEYIAWRLRKTLAIPEGLDVLVDHQTLSLKETETGTVCRIMAGAVRRDLLVSLSTLLADLDLELMAIDTSTLGVYSLLEDLHPENTVDRTLIMCHIGHETTVVRFFQNGLIAYERVIEGGGEEFTKLFATTENLDFEKAQVFKAKKKFFPQGKREILAQIPKRESIARVFGNWLREMSVTFRFYQDKFQVVRLPRIYLTGGSCLFAGLPEFMADYFDTPCDRFNPIGAIPSPVPIDERVVAQGPTFAPSLGLLAR